MIERAGGKPVSGTQRPAPDKCLLRGAGASVQLKPAKLTPEKCKACCCTPLPLMLSRYHRSRNMPVEMASIESFGTRDGNAQTKPPPSMLPISLARRRQAISRVACPFQSPLLYVLRSFQRRRAILEQVPQLIAKFRLALMLVHRPAVLHRDVQYFLFRIRTEGDRAIRFAREFNRYIYET